MIAAPGGDAGRPARSYEQTAAPFDWPFTESDLDRLLRRLEEHEHPARAA
jgi:hypothetical protein